LLVLHVAICTASVFGCAVCPLKQQAEGERFQNRKEGAHAIVDVVVGEQACRREKFAVEYRKDDLLHVSVSGRRYEQKTQQHVVLKTMTCVPP
jgi:hypothetical protein